MASLSQRAYQIGKQQIGVAEIPGDADNPQIIEYDKCVDLDPAEYGDNTSWCSAAHNYCHQQAGGRGTRNAMARSWLHWGKKVATPQEGDTVVLWRNSPTSELGHVGFFVKQDLLFVYIMGGNQNNSYNISKYPRFRVLGYRRSLDG